MIRAAFLGSHVGMRHTAAVRSPAFLFGILATGTALVAFPAQDLPILFRDDVTMIGLSLVALAVASTVAGAGWARRGATWRKALCLPAATAATISLLAVAGYKVVGAIGWPTARIMLGPAMAAAAGALGFGIGRLVQGRRRLAALALTVPVAAFGVAPAGAITVELSKPDFGTASLDDCTTRDGVRYCALDGFDPLIDDWAFVVEGVLAQVPHDAARRARRLPVVQTGGAEANGPARRALAQPLTGWGRPGSGEGNARATLALGVASSAVGAFGAAHSARPSSDTASARDIVIWWLAGQVSSDAADQVRMTGSFADNVTGTNYADSPVPSVAASRYAAQLLDRDRGDVGDALRANWVTFTDPATPADELVASFDLALVAIPVPQG
jgi:hypothetical protein